MKLSVNNEIAATHILTNKKQTLIASLGVTIGVALYIFSNSMVTGFGNYSKGEMFKSIPHIRVYKKDEISKPLLESEDINKEMIILNPKIITISKSIIDPFSLVEEIKKQPYVTASAAQVNVDLFYINGKSQLKGMANGVNISEADAMFDIQSTLLAGDLQSITSDLNAIIIGNELASNMNVGLDDNITITSALGIKKVMRVTAIFSTGNKSIDETKSYVHISTAQQLAKESTNYVTDIYASVSNPDSSLVYASQLQEITSYDVEDWQTANADQLAQDSVVGTMTPLISISIMMVAAFGIYNILSMTISQKLNDIAILKANGFKGKDIVQIFVSEALIMGLIGTLIGMTLGAIFISILQGVYIGPPIGYFPVFHDAKIFITGGLFGLIVSLGAGYFPARKASKVDPVEIFRK